MKEPARPAPGSPGTGAMMKGRQADSARRRQRVLAALDRAAADGAGGGPHLHLPAPGPP